MFGKSDDKTAKDKLYPNCDPSVWLRSCEEEISLPIEAKVTGSIPAWVQGDLVRNGPGCLHLGNTQLKHLFDSSALLHRFNIESGRVSYQCRFVCSNTLVESRAANRLVHAEFGTQAAPDPCRTIFDRISAVFNPSVKMSDNTMISVYPFGDELYAFGEHTVIHRIDPQTLDTIDSRDLSLDNIGIVNHTSHPHIDSNGDVYNMAMRVSKGVVRHVIVKFPLSVEGGGDMFSRAAVVGSMEARKAFTPSYMHSFGMTPEWWVGVQQPLGVSAPKMLLASMRGGPLRSALVWDQSALTHLVLISRRDGLEKKRFLTDPLFFLHVINAFEDGGDVVLDLCAYKDAKVIDAMYIHAMENMQSNADYANWFNSRPTRLRLPIDSPNMSFVKPSYLADVSCETPRINYSFANGRPYRYFYAISSDVASTHPGTLLKVDTWSGEIWRWYEKDCYPSEPVFVPNANRQDEDSGVVLAALVWAAHPTRVGLVVLDAHSWRPLATALANADSPVPKCLHGWFLPHKITPNT